RVPLQSVEALPQMVDRDMVQQGSEPCTLVLACCHTHTVQAARRAGLAQRRGRGRLHHIPLGRSPSLHHLRRPHALVRRLLWYYSTVRLPTRVHAGRTAVSLLRPTSGTIPRTCESDLPVAL